MGVEEGDGGEGVAAGSRGRYFRWAMTTMWRRVMSSM